MPTSESVLKTLDGAIKTASKEAQKTTFEAKRRKVLSRCGCL